MSHQPRPASLMKSGFFTFLFLIIGGFGGFALRILYANILPEEVFGMFNALLFFAPILLFLSTLGLHDALSYFIPRLKEQERSRLFSQAFTLILVLDVVIILLFTLSLPLIKHAYLHTPSIPFSLLLGMTVFFAFQPLLYFIMDAWRSLRQEYYYTLIEGTRLILLLILSLLIFLTLHQPLLIFLAWILAHPFLFTITFFHFLKHVRLYLTHPLGSMIRKALPTSILLSLSGFTMHVLFNIDIFFITLLLGVRMVAVYGALLPFTSILLILARAFTILLLPRLSGHPQRGLLTPLFTFITGLFLTGYLILFTIIPLFFPFLIPAYAQDRVLFTILLTAALATSLALILLTILAAYGWMRERFTLAILTLTANSILTPLFIRQHGLNGAAYATLLSSILLIILSILLLTRVEGSRLTLLFPVFIFFILLPFNPFLMSFFIIILTSILLILSRRELLILTKSLMGREDKHYSE